MRYFFFILLPGLLCLAPQDLKTRPVIAKFKTLTSVLDGLISYYKRHQNEVNLDGIFGPLILQHTIRRILYVHSYPWTLQNQLSYLLESLESVILSALPALKQKDEVYFEKLGTILQLDWSPKFPSVLLVSESYGQWASPVDGVFTEDVSDNCLHELFKLNLTEQRCRLSVACKTALLTHNLGGYEATHTVLYLTVIELLGCQDIVNGQLTEFGTNMYSLITDRCAEIYSSFRALLRDDVSIYDKRDLLLEQIFICGFRGFDTFIKLPLLDTIKSWQDPSGCFGGIDRNIGTTRATTNSGRTLLFEERLVDGCLTHLTSVATAALAVYLNYFLRPLDISGENAVILRLVEIYYLLQGNATVPPLLADTQPEQPSEPKQRWVPSVAADLIPELGKPHGLFGLMVHRHLPFTPVLRREVSINTEHFGASWYFMGFVILSLVFLTLAIHLYRHLPKISRFYHE
ncbi:hypothetical protein CRM22_000271 [Opisthorchis felineus]|nr:hypothetical protein CRM22_000271 [Opisthorchis felineus]